MKPALSVAPDRSLSTDADGVLAALARLGSCADEIAATLRHLGCRGQPGICVTCPLAHYLELVLPDLDYTDAQAGSAVEVYGDTALVRFSTGAVSVQMPAPVEEFVLLFDQGRYWFLDETGQPAHVRRGRRSLRRHRSRGRRGFWVALRRAHRARAA